MLILLFFLVKMEKIMQTRGRLNSPYNWSKPETGKISHADAKNAQNGLNEPSKAQSVAPHPSTSVISNSKSDVKHIA